jgi:hypothetical protein
LGAVASALAAAQRCRYDSQGTAHGRFQCAIQRRHVQAAEMAAREMEAQRWLQRFIDERLPPLPEVALAASALAELRHGNRNVGSRR